MFQKSRIYNNLERISTQADYSDDFPTGRPYTFELETTFLGWYLERWSKEWQASSALWQDVDDVRNEIKKLEDFESGKTTFRPQRDFNDSAEVAKIIYEAGRDLRRFYPDIYDKVTSDEIVALLFYVDDMGLTFGDDDACLPFEGKDETIRKQYEMRGKRKKRGNWTKPRRMIDYTFDKATREKWRKEELQKEYGAKLAEWKARHPN